MYTLHNFIGERRVHTSCMATILQIPTQNLYSSWKYRRTSCCRAATSYILHSKLFADALCTGFSAHTFPLWSVWRNTTTLLKIVTLIVWFFAKFSLYRIWTKGKSDFCICCSNNIMIVMNFLIKRLLTVIASMLIHHIMRADKLFQVLLLLMNIFLVERILLKSGIKIYWKWSNKWMNESSRAHQNVSLRKLVRCSPIDVIVFTFSHAVITCGNALVIHKRLSSDIY